jgi:excisionase family DNA binding protein
MRRDAQDVTVVPIREAAGIAGVHKQTVERAIDRGELQSYRRGPAVRGVPRYLRRSEVEQWAQERRRLRPDE